MTSNTSNTALHLAGLLLLTGCVTPASAIDPTCQPFLDASRKVLTTPAHLYSTTIAGYNHNQPENGEMIYTGGLKGAIYVMVKGKWTRSQLTPEAMLQQKDENLATGKVTCRVLRDEAVNGEAAVVYTSHQDTEDAKVDVTAWISKRSGLPLREDVDMDVGGGPLGKSHQAMRFEYSNIHAPDGVH